MEERILTALAGTSGMTAKELGKALGEPTPIVMEQLRTMAATGQLTQRQVGRDQVFSLAKKAVPTPREILPVGPSITELVDAGQLAPASWPDSVPMFAMVPDEAIAPTRAWLLEKPTLYDRIGGTITLEIGDSPIKARFQSVEQLHRFLTDLIETERAGQVPAEGKV